MSILDSGVVIITQQYWPDLLLDCVIVKIWQLETPPIVISVLVTNIIQETAATHNINLSLDILRVRPVTVMLQRRSPHYQQPGQDVDEDSSDPGRHGVGLWGPEVDVKNHHGDADTEGVEDHGEEDKLPEQGHHQGGGRDDLGQQEEEHGEGEEDVN